MTDEVPYDVVKKIENLEIRRYPEVIFAVVEDNVDDSGFGLLFQYISGENKTRSRIAMTAPVVTSEKIKMTTPVVTRKDYMAFAIPSSYNKNTVPLPTNSSVKIEAQPEKTMAVLRFGGRTPEPRVQKFIQELVTILNAHKIQMKGEPVLMRYNSPFTPGFLRRNEVAVEIDEIDKWLNLVDKMPHVVLNGNVNLDEIFNKFKGVFIHNDQGILKTNTVYMSRDKTAILIESLAIEKGVNNSFLALISHRNDGVVVRIYPGIEVEKTSGVKNILSEIAKQLLAEFPQLTIGETNLSEYLR